MVSFEIISDGIRIRATGLLKEDQEIVLDAFDIDDLKNIIHIFEAGDHIE